jgi:hypothetical protein
LHNNHTTAAVRWFLGNEGRKNRIAQGAAAGATAMKVIASKKNSALQDRSFGRLCQTGQTEATQAPLE